jgi:TRAP-type C4-dicarboxylate transport system permease small subunit
MMVLRWLAQACAVLAGVLLTAITLLTVTSVIGRDVFGKGINGDFELVGVITGAAVALFLPWAQIKRGNIIVDFFTSKASDRANAMMDRAGALLIGVFFALLAWRTSLGGLNAWETKSGSMMLGFPEWITYTFIVPPLVLAVLVSFSQAIFGFERLDPPVAPKAEGGGA